MDIEFKKGGRVRATKNCFGTVYGKVYRVRKNINGYLVIGPKRREGAFARILGKR